MVKNNLTYGDVSLSAVEIGEKDSNGLRKVLVFPRGTYSKRVGILKKQTWDGDDSLFNGMVNTHQKFVDKFGVKGAKLASDYNHAFDHSKAVDPESQIASGHTFDVENGEKGFIAHHKFTERAEGYIEAGEYDRISGVMNTNGYFNDQGEWIEEPIFKGLSLCNRPFHKNTPCLTLTESSTGATITTEKETLGKGEGNVDEITVKTEEWKDNQKSVITLTSKVEQFEKERKGNVLLSEADAKELETLRDEKKTWDEKEETLKLSEAKVLVEKLVAGGLEKKNAEFAQTLYLSDKKQFDAYVKLHGADVVLDDRIGDGGDPEPKPPEATKTIRQEYRDLQHKLKKDRDISLSEAEDVIRSDHNKIHEAYMTEIFG